ncbi:MAG TPA: hypothetical protein VFQ62_12285 [Methylomirabilota bacterium]|nr:hypothetical protein [Methylomirabilota bacterium]
MKKRPAAKKPAARKSAPKKTTKATKASAASKPVRTEERAARATYTPTPIQGIGWAPFRYPA